MYYRKSYLDFAYYMVKSLQLELPFNLPILERPIQCNINMNC